MAIKMLLEYEVLRPNTNILEKHVVVVWVRDVEEGFRFAEKGDYPDNTKITFLF